MCEHVAVTSEETGKKKKKKSGQTIARSVVNGNSNQDKQMSRRKVKWEKKSACELA